VLARHDVLAHRGRGHITVMDEITVAASRLLLEAICPYQISLDAFRLRRASQAHKAPPVTQISAMATAEPQRRDAALEMAAF